MCGGRAGAASAAGAHLVIWDRPAAAAADPSACVCGGAASEPFLRGLGAPLPPGAGGAGPAGVRPPPALGAPPHFAAAVPIAVRALEAYVLTPPLPLPKFRPVELPLGEEKIEVADESVDTPPAAAAAAPPPPAPPPLPHPTAVRPPTAPSTPTLAGAAGTPRSRAVSKAGFA